MSANKWSNTTRMSHNHIELEKVARVPSNLKKKHNQNLKRVFLKLRFFDHVPFSYAASHIYLCLANQI